MNEQYSNTSQTASAFYDPESSCWRTCQASLQLDLDEEVDWTLLQRLPDWIMWDGQALFEQATPTHLINVRAGGALPNLPTPLTDSEAEQSLDRYGPNLGMVLKDLVSTNPRFSGGAAALDDLHPTLLMGTGDSRTTLSSG